MITRLGSGWQTVLADLSLILFMVTAAAVADAEAGSDVPVQSGPVAVWRPGSVSLGTWLTDQPRDPRLQLTIVAPYTGDAIKALERFGPVPVGARIILDPAPGTQPVATLAYDLRPKGTSQ